MPPLNQIVFASTATLNSNQSSKTLSFGIQIAGDTTKPIVQIHSPVVDSEHTQPTDIIATINDENLISYKLAYALTGTTDYTTIAEGNTNIDNATIGKLDTTLIQNGLYDLRLTAIDANGNQSGTIITVDIKGQMKIGHFSITFEDLHIPLAALPITVHRTYDSRNKTQGDFGFGWTLNIQDVKIQENQPPGKNWELVQRGNQYVPQWCVLPIGNHYVSVRLPGERHPEEFNISAQPECATYYPQLDVLPTFTARSGTDSTLVADDIGALRYENGQLTDPVTREIYDIPKYTLTTAAGFEYALDQRFGVLSVKDPDNNTLVFNNDGVIHSAGQSILYTRDDQNRITQITDPMSHTLKYTYDTNGDLTRFTDAEGNITTFTYYANHFLNQIIDPLGRPIAKNIYDQDGRLIKQIDGLGNEIQTNHDLAAHREEVKDRRSNIIVFTYDDQGNVLTETDPLGNTTTRTYDSRGNALTETNPLGQTTTKTYDARDRVLSETDPLGNTTTYTYNKRNNVTSVTDAKGQTTQIAYYEPNGKLFTIQDSQNNTLLRNLYGPRGFILVATDALGYQTANVNGTEPNDYGQRTKQTDATGAITTWTYTPTSQVKTETIHRTNATGQTDQETTTYDYDSNNRIIKTTDAQGHFTTTEYTKIGKVLATTDKNGNRTHHEYDIMANRIKTTYPDNTIETWTYDRNNNQTSHTNRAGQTTQYEYDANDRLIKTITPDGHFTRTLYNPAGQVKQTIDENGHSTHYTYDDAGRRLTITNHIGAQTQYTYDKNGNQTSITDANHHTTQYQYDHMDRRIKTIFHDNTEITTTYDLKGQRIAETDQEGNTTQFEYDGQGRLTKVIDALAHKTSYNYDEAGNKLTQTDANHHTTHWTYDSLGRTLSRTLPLNMSEQFEYDANGNLKKHTNFNQAITHYTYNHNNQLTNKTLPTQTVTYTYNPNGLADTITDQHGITRYTYDQRNRLTRIEEPNNKRQDYTYDPTGQRTSVTTSSGQTTQFEYDPLNRLSKVIDPQGGETFMHYDGLGSTRALSNEQGNLDNQYFYRAFGELHHSTGNTSNSYLFAGEQFDSNAGLYYLRARYMDPINGRFRGMDTFQGFQSNPVTLHKYLYANVNPANNIDPSGNSALLQSMTALGVGALLMATTISLPQIGQTNSNSNYDTGGANDVTLGLTILGIFGGSSGLRLVNMLSSSSEKPTESERQAARSAGETIANSQARRKKTINKAAIGESQIKRVAPAARALNAISIVYIDDYHYEKPISFREKILSLAYNYG